MKNNLIKMSALVEVAEFKNFYANQSNEELKTSILEEGLKTPIIVSKDYTLIDGYRRVQVYQDLGYEYISCVFVEEQPTLQERITRNMTRQKSSQDIVNEYRHVFLRYPKKQGKRNHDGTPYVRDQKISDALGGKFKGDVIVNKLEKILFNDLEGDILSKGIVDKNWKVDTCHDFLFKWKEIDEMKKYGFTKQLTDGQLSVSEVNKFVEEKEGLDNKFENSFIIPDKISVWNEDCRMIDKLLNYDKVVDLLFSSPPYWCLRSYDEVLENQRGHEKTKEEYAQNIAKDIQKIEPVLKESGSVVINIGETYIDGLAQGIPFLIRDAILKHTNLFHVDTYIWSKKNSRPQGEGVKRLQNSIEYLFHFVKDPKKYKFNVLKYPVEGKISKLVSGAKDVSKDGRVCKKSKSISKNYGKLVSHLKEQEIENIVTTSNGKDHELYNIISSGHPAPMSPMLPVTFILMLTGELDTVADIWGGSQVTGKISTLLNRRYVSTEISKEYFNIGCQRLLNAVSDFSQESLDQINEILLPKYKAESIDINNINESNDTKIDMSYLDKIEKIQFEDQSLIFKGDNIDVLKTIPDNSIDSVVTDGPYGISFLGNNWDKKLPCQNLWYEVFRVLKPGGHILSFGSPKTCHKMVFEIENTGFEIIDQLIWVSNPSFSKGVNIDKAIDRRGGNNNLTHVIAKELKSARESRNISKIAADEMFCNGTTNYMWFEGRKDGVRLPDEETFKRICCEWPELEKYRSLITNAEREIIGQYSTDGGGFGEKRIGKSGLNITVPKTKEAKKWEGWRTSLKTSHESICLARKPISENTFAENILVHGTGAMNIKGCKNFTLENFENINNSTENSILKHPTNIILSSTLCEEFNKEFYFSKASRKDKNEGLMKLTNTHPTVKPTDLMQYLVRLVTPKGGICLDPFGGSGATAKGCIREGVKFILIEKESEYFEIAKQRIQFEFFKSNINHN